MRSLRLTRIHRIRLRRASAAHRSPLSHLRALLSVHHAALMPTFSLYYLNLPGHRNLWQEPAAAILDSANMYMPPDPATGELTYPLSPWTRHIPSMTQR